MAMGVGWCGWPCPSVCEPSIKSPFILANFSQSPLTAVNDRSKTWRRELSSTHACNDWQCVLWPHMCLQEHPFVWETKWRRGQAVEAACLGFHSHPQWCGAWASPLTPFNLSHLTYNIQIVTPTHGVWQGQLIPKYGSHEWSSWGSRPWVVPPMLTLGWSCLWFNYSLK